MPDEEGATQCTTARELESERELLALLSRPILLVRLRRLVFSFARILLTTMSLASFWF